MNRRNFLKSLAGLTVAGAVAGKLTPVNPPADDSIGVVRACRFYATEEMLEDAAIGFRVTPTVFLIRDGKRTPYRSLSAAMNDAQAGDEIFVRGGSLGEHVYGGEDIDL